jgi:hypothetical protein
MVAEAISESILSRLTSIRARHKSEIVFEIPVAKLAAAHLKT